MIIINTSHILPDTPYLLDGTESAEILELPPDADPPLAPAGDITYHLSALMAGADLIVTGRASVPLATVCARCLDDITVTIAVKDLCFHFEKVRDLEVDLTDDVREELLLAFPSCFYCSPDCKGICPMCGANLNHASCACDTREAEPEPDAAAPSPWDQLDALDLSPKKPAAAVPPGWLSFPLPIYSALFLSRLARPRLMRATSSPSMWNTGGGSGA